MLEGACQHVRMHLDSRTARRMWPPILGWQKAVTVTLVAFIVLDLTAGLDDFEVPPLGTVAYYAYAALGVLFFGQVLLVILAPRVGFPTASVLGLVLALTPGVSAIGAWWLVPAVLSSWAAVRWFLAGRTTPTVQTRVPWEGDYASSVAYRTPVIGYAASGALVAVALLLALFHQFAVHDTQRFEAQAVPATAVVLTEPDEDGYFTAGIDGREVELDVWYLEDEPAVGDRLPVRIDPEDRDHVVLGDSPEDPSWLLGLAVLALLLTGFPYARWVRPARARRRLLDSGGSARSARLIDLPDSYLLPTDGTWPVISLGPLQGTTAMSEVEEFFEGQDDDDEDEPEETLPTTTEELEAFLRQTQLTPDEDALLYSAFGPDAERPLEVSVIGEPVPGGSVAIVHRGRAWLADVGPARWRPGLRRRIERASRGSLRESPVSALVSFHPQALRLAWAVASVVLCVFVVQGAVAEDDWFAGALVALCVACSGPLEGLAAESFTLTEGRLRLLGRLRDEVITPGRVAAMAADADFVALRVSDPDELLVLPVPVVVGRFRATGQEALTRLEQWRRLGDAGSVSGYRPSLLVWGAGASVIATLVTLAFLLP